MDTDARWSMKIGPGEVDVNGKTQPDIAISAFGCPMEVVETRKIHQYKPTEMRNYSAETTIIMTDPRAIAMTVCPRWRFRSGLDESCISVCYVLWCCNSHLTNEVGRCHATCLFIGSSPTLDQCSANAKRSALKPGRYMVVH